MCVTLRNGSYANGLDLDQVGHKVGPDLDHSDGILQRTYVPPTKGEGGHIIAPGADPVGVLLQIPVTSFPCIIF